MPASSKRPELIFLEEELHIAECTHSRQMNWDPPKTASHPKFYLFDNGLYRRLRLRGPLDIESEISGPALEGLVGQHLRAYSDFALQDTKLFYWRSLAGNEVYFVLYGVKTFTAVEVKNTKVLRPTDYNGLVSFGDDYPEASLVLLYRGNVPLKHKNILAVPVELFLKNPGEYLKDLRGKW